LPIDTSLLGPESIASIAASGNTLYALSQRPEGDELLSYDLTQDISSSFTYLPNTILPIDTSILAPESIVAIAADGTPSGGGGGGSTPVPEPSTYALMMIGVLALAAIQGRRFHPIWKRA
jgi:hypothetical protein